MAKKYIDQEKAEKIIAEVINRNGTEGENKDDELERKDA